MFCVLLKQVVSTVYVLSAYHARYIKDVHLIHYPANEFRTILNVHDKLLVHL